MSRAGGCFVREGVFFRARREVGRCKRDLFILGSLL